MELISKYEKYYEMSVEEYNFQKYIENELGKDMWKHIFLFVSVSGVEVVDTGVWL